MFSYIFKNTVFWLCRFYRLEQKARITCTIFQTAQLKIYGLLLRLGETQPHCHFTSFRKAIYMLYRARYTPLRNRHIRFARTTRIIEKQFYMRSTVKKTVYIYYDAIEIGMPRQHFFLAGNNYIETNIYIYNIYYVVSRDFLSIT